MQFTIRSRRPESCSSCHSFLVMSLYNSSSGRRFWCQAVWEQSTEPSLYP